MEEVTAWFTSLRDPRRALVAGVIIAGFLWAFLQSAGASDFFSFTVIGIAEGSVFAVAAMGLVVTYSTTGVFNFAHGAVGMIAAFVYYSLTGQPCWTVRE